VNTNTHVLLLANAVTHTDRGQGTGEGACLLQLSFFIVLEPDGLYSQVLLGFQLPNRCSPTHVIRLLAAQTLSVRMELALACRNTKVTRIPVVALNASSVQTVRETGRASETSVPTLARGLVARGPRVTS
jgi:hypothetical protein